MNKASRIYFSQKDVKRKMYTAIIWSIAALICCFAAILGVVAGVRLWKRRAEANWSVRITLVGVLTVLMIGATLNAIAHLLR